MIPCVPLPPLSKSDRKPSLPINRLINGMPSQTHTTLASGHSTPHSDDEVLVRVDGVGKKFCRSLKKSLWYGVCDIAGELLPGRKRRETRDEGRELPDRSAQDISRSPLDAGLSTAAASALDSTCSASALDPPLWSLDSASPSMAPCWDSRKRNRSAGLQLVESYGSERRRGGRVP
jgi:hypothetical protein